MLWKKYCQSPDPDDSMEFWPRSTAQLWLRDVIDKTECRIHLQCQLRADFKCYLPAQDFKIKSCAPRFSNDSEFLNRVENS